MAVRVIVDGVEIDPEDYALILKKDGRWPDLLEKYPALYELWPRQLDALKELGVSFAVVHSSHLVGCVIREAQKANE